ncbi:MAG: hypothetical protein M5U28_33295 [Sandaracinaceae bacterium]|nr:hypothetical protein [Sandaracinaceae bacterium]
MPRYYDVHTDRQRVAEAEAAARKALEERVPEAAAQAGIEIAVEVRVAIRRRRSSPRRRTCTPTSSC